MENNEEKLKGIEVHRELIKALNNIKQGSVLENSIYTLNSRVFDEHLQFKENIKREMLASLIGKLFVKYKESFIETKTPFDAMELNLRLLIIDTSELNHIVEYCIRTMPLSAIEEIRK